MTILALLCVLGAIFLLVAGGLGAKFGRINHLLLAAGLLVAVWLLFHLAMFGVHA